MIIRPGYESSLRAQGLDTLQALFEVTHAEALNKPGLDPWRERLRLQVRVKGVESTCYLKRFTNPPESAQRQVRRSGSGARSVAGLEWAWAGQLATHGIPSIEPIAFGEELGGRRELRSALLTVAAPGASLEQWAQRWGPKDGTLVKRLIPSVAALVARFHQCGYVHRDLYLSHIFYDPSGAGTEPTLHVIDLQRVIRPRVFLRRWIVKDVASLNASAPCTLVSRADRLRWLKHYLGIRKLDPMAKGLAIRVIGKTASIRRHEIRRRARLT